MSYDLVVFEKTKAPADTAEFSAWYKKQTEWRDDCDYIDISHASENLQRFFQEIRNIFPPMNGMYAPSDEELSNSPELEERLCDYCIGEDIIYLSFAYSMSHSAYDIVKRAACFMDVGFFVPEGECIPIFFENRYPMLLEGEWFRPIKVSDFSSISEKLNQMTVRNHSYLFLTDQIGNYIQIGGYCDSLTVEKRVHTGIQAYTHEKAGYSSSEKTNEDGYVVIAGNRVKVKQQQVLSKDTAEQLLKDFFQETETADFIEWTAMDM